jgi:hypothetical protein
MADAFNPGPTPLHRRGQPVEAMSVTLAANQTREPPGKPITRGLAKQ